MEFFRRASKTASDITPPIVVIEELKSEIADLKDELQSAIQAKKFATETLKSQLELNGKTELELVSVRKELLELLARQQAEVPVMAAPSPNGSNRIILDSGELVSIGELETLIKQLSERVIELEHLNEGLRAEADSLKTINRENMKKMREILAEKHNRVDEKELSRLREECAASNERIVELEQIIHSSAEEIERIHTEATEENEVLRMKIGALETEVIQLRGDLDEELHAKERRERELEQQAMLIDSLRNDLANSTQKSDELKKSAGEYEDQILELVGQVATLKNENGSLKISSDNAMKELIQARQDAAEASRRLELVVPKIDEAHSALVKAVQTALDARKETLIWKNKYEADIRGVTERVKNLSSGRPRISPVDLLN